MMYDSFIIDGTKIYVLLFAFVVSYNVFFFESYFAHDDDAVGHDGERGS